MCSIRWPIGSAARATSWIPRAGYADVASRRCAQKSFDLVLADVRLRDGDGFDLLGNAAAMLARRQVILMTGYGIAGWRRRSDSGQGRSTTSPSRSSTNELLMTIERAISQRSGSSRKTTTSGAARSPLRNGQHRRPRPADA